MQFCQTPCLGADGRNALKKMVGHLLNHMKKKAEKPREAMTLWGRNLSLVRWSVLCSVNVPLYRVLLSLGCSFHHIMANANPGIWAAGRSALRHSTRGCHTCLQPSAPWWEIQRQDGSCQRRQKWRSCKEAIESRTRLVSNRPGIFAFWRCQCRDCLQGSSQSEWTQSSTLAQVFRVHWKPVLNQGEMSKYMWLTPQFQDLGQQVSW